MNRPTELCEYGQCVINSSDVEGGDCLCCKVPPLGWRCTREEGHEGPCAAIPVGRSEEQNKIDRYILQRYLEDCCPTCHHARCVAMGVLVGSFLTIAFAFIGKWAS